MKHFLRFSPLVLLSVLFACSRFSAGHKIAVQIKGQENQDIILAHYLNKSIFPDDTINLDNEGKGTFSGKRPLPGGMYIIYLPSGKYFEFLMGDDQDFSLTTDTLSFIDSAVIKGSEDNRIFFDFQKYMISKKDELTRLRKVLTGAAGEEEKSEARQRMKELTEERIERVKGITLEYPELFVSAFLKGTLEIDVPDPPIREDGTIDSAWQYKYYKHHYFDNFNPHDGRLLRTPLYEDKVMHYLEHVAVQIPDSLIREVDYLLEGAQKDSVLFRYLLVTLFNHFGNSNIMGMDAVQVHLASAYYLKHAWWIDEDFREELETRVKALEPLILGNVAPDIELLFVPGDHFKAAENDSVLKSYPHVGELKMLHEIPGDYIVLFFWEADCSHCKKAVPKLYQIFKEELQPLGIKVIAISTLFGEEGKVEWVDFVNRHGLYDWLNAWNPYEYQYKIQYDIRTTPQIFILNKEKKIIGKRIGPEQVPELIRAYRAEYKK